MRALSDVKAVAATPEEADDDGEADPDDEAELDDEAEPDDEAELDDEAEPDDEADLDDAAGPDDEAELDDEGELDAAGAAVDGSVLGDGDGDGEGEGEGLGEGVGEGDVVLAVGSTWHIWSVLAAAVMGLSEAACAVPDQAASMHTITELPVSKLSVIARTCAKRIDMPRLRCSSLLRCVLLGIRRRLGGGWV